MVSDVAAAVIRLQQSGCESHHMGVKPRPVTTQSQSKVSLKSAQVAFMVGRVGRLVRFGSDWVCRLSWCVYDASPTVSLLLFRLFSWAAAPAHIYEQYA